MAAFVVTLDTFSFGVTDSDGDRFVLRDIVGWTGIPVDLVTIDYPVSAGTAVVSSRYKARPLVLQGFGIASTPANIWRVRAKLEAAADLAFDDVILTVPEPAGTATLTVRLSDTMRIRLLGNRLVEFEMPLLAADPAKTSP